MSEPALCPTCKQPLPRDAITYGTRGPSVKPKCEYGIEPHDAEFIIGGVAVCVAHSVFVRSE
jgi:hypothetical protein